jgi:hypothetical protein
MCRRAERNVLNYTWKRFGGCEVVHTGHIKNATNYGNNAHQFSLVVFQFCDDDVSKLPRLIARESNQLSRNDQSQQKTCQIIRIEKSMNLDLGSSAFATADYFLRTNANA